MEQVAAAAAPETVDVDEIVLEALGFNGFVCDLRAIDEMASADAAKEAASETVSNAFAGVVIEPDELTVLMSLSELSKATKKMSMAATAGEDVVGQLGIPGFCRGLLETIEEITKEVAGGEEIVFLEASFVALTLELLEGIEDFPHMLEDAIDAMTTTGAANEAVLETLPRDLEEDMDDEAVADGEALLDDVHQEATGRVQCSGSGSGKRTGFLGRYGFGTPQDLLSID